MKRLLLLLVLCAASLPAQSAYAIPGNTSASFGYTFWSGSVAGTVAYLTVPFSCTITGWTVISTTGTASVDVWKIAAGTSLPTVANKITGSSIPTLSSGSIATGTGLIAAGWSTVSVAAGDIFAFDLYAIGTAGATITAQLNCQR